MEEVYIKVDSLNQWVAKYFKNKDIISIWDLVGVIEDLDDDNERLQIKIKELESEIKDMQYGTCIDDYEDRMLGLK